MGNCHVLLDNFFANCGSGIYLCKLSSYFFQTVFFLQILVRDTFFLEIVVLDILVKIYPCGPLGLGAKFAKWLSCKAFISHFMLIKSFRFVFLLVCGLSIYVLPCARLQATNVAVTEVLLNSHCSK